MAYLESGIFRDCSGRGARDLRLQSGNWRSSQLSTSIQFDVFYANGSIGRRGRDRLSPSGNRAVDFCAVQKRARYGPEEIAVRDRADREGVPERDQPAELHFSLARVRADGARIFLPAGAGDGAAGILEGRAPQILR